MRKQQKCGSLIRTSKMLFFFFLVCHETKAFRFVPFYSLTPASERTGEWTLWNETELSGGTDMTPSERLWHTVRFHQLGNENDNSRHLPASKQKKNRHGFRLLLKSALATVHSPRSIDRSVRRLIDRSAQPINR